MSVPGPVPLVVHHDLLQWKDATEAPAVDGGGEGPEVPTGWRPGRRGLRDYSDDRASDILHQDISHHNKLESVSLVVEVPVVSAPVPAAGEGPHAAVPLDPLVCYPLVAHQDGAARVVGPRVRLPVRPAAG